MGIAHTRYWPGLFLGPIFLCMHANHQNRATHSAKYRPALITPASYPGSRGASPGSAPAVGRRMSDPLAVGIEEFVSCPCSALLLKRTTTRLQGSEKPPLEDNIPGEISTHFAFPSPTARHVSLAGDFNDWNPTSMPMRRGHDGVWRRNVSLKPGCHEYRFVADGDWLDDPAAGQRIANTLGTRNCVRMVASRRSATIPKR